MLQINTSDAVLTQLYIEKMEQQPVAQYGMMRFAANAPELTGEQALKMAGGAGLSISGEFPSSIVVKLPSSLALAPSGQGPRNMGYTHVMETPLIATSLKAGSLSGIEDSAPQTQLLFNTIKVNNFGLEEIIKADEQSEYLGGNWSLALAKRVVPRLKNAIAWNEAWYGIMGSLYEGYSARHLLSSLSMAGSLFTPAETLGVVPEDHPNFCVPGLPSGEADGARFAEWSATPATYRSRLAKNITRIGVDEIFKPSYGMLEVLYEEAYRLLNWSKTANGSPQFTMIVPWRIMQHLLRDATFRDVAGIMSHGSDRGDIGETFRLGKPLQVGNFEIHVQDHVGAQVYTDDVGNSYTLSTANGPGLTITEANADSIYYGYRNASFTPRNMADPRVNSSETQDNGARPWLSRWVGWIFADKATVGLVGKPTRIERQMRIYNTKQSAAIIGCDGYRRQDWFEYLAGSVDTPVEASGVKNYSSIPFACYAPPVNVI